MLYYEKQFTLLQIMSQKRTCRIHVPFDRGNKVMTPSACARERTRRDDDDDDDREMRREIHTRACLQDLNVSCS